MMKKNSEWKKTLLAGIWTENPLFVSLLGLCPALAVTKSLEAAFGMGVLFTIVLTCSSVLVSLLRKIIPESIKTPCEIVIIATFVTIVKMLSEAFLPELYATLGVFLSLLVVNCIVLGRSEAFAIKNGPGLSFLDAIGNGIGYTLAICIIAIIREILGTGMLTFGDTLTFIAELNNGQSIHLYMLTGPTTDPRSGPAWDYSMSFFANPAGAFLVLGIILAIIAAVNIRKAEHKKVDEKLAKLKELEEKRAALAKAREAQGQ